MKVKRAKSPAAAASTGSTATAAALPPSPTLVSSMEKIVDVISIKIADIGNPTIHSAIDSGASVAITDEKGLPVATVNSFKGLTDWDRQNILEVLEHYSQSDADISNTISWEQAKKKNSR